jgi:PadR family transcriptional regulator PadR
MHNKLLLRNKIMKLETQLLKGIAPAIVLKTLSRGEMYGYELSTAIENKTENILTLGKGTLYPLLYNLEAKKLIKSEWQTAPNNRKRRYYSITAKGKKALAKDTQQLARLFEGLKLVFESNLLNPEPA